MKQWVSNCDISKQEGWRRFRAAVAARRQRRVLAAASVLSGAVPVEAPQRDAELLRFFGEVGRDPGAGEHEDADRQSLDHSVVELERPRRCGAASLVMVLGLRQTRLLESSVISLVHLQSCCSYPIGGTSQYACYRLG